LQENKPIQSLKVSVAGEEFLVRTDTSQATLNEIASWVNSKIDELVVPGSRIDNRKQLVMVSLAIAGELFEKKAKIKDLESKIQQYQQKSELLFKKLSSLDI
jgi:cell division protein ZapA (FtsZ GTPase activity inhibitor)